MADRTYIWHTGEFYSADAPVLRASNRAFRYGDGLFETIHCYGTEPRYLSLHYQRLLKGMELMDMESPFWLTEKKIYEAIVRLLNKNRFFGSTRVRVSVYREGEGLYTPDDNTVSVVIDSKPLDYSYYSFNSNGLVIDIFPDIRKPINILSSIKSCNSLIYVKAGLFRQTSKLDDCVILNEFGRVAESISSNIFVVKNGEIFTPGVGEGCIPGIMRRVVIDLAQKMGYKVFPDVALNPKVFRTCDEVFLTNAINGIQWVLGMGPNRYFNTISKQLSIELNKKTFSASV